MKKMNEPIHFATGYLIALLFKKKYDSFSALFLSMAAFSPDFDYIIRYFYPSFQHGVITHTFLGGLLCYTIFFLLSLPFIKKFQKNVYGSIWKLYLLGILAMISHLVLDAFTFYEGVSSDMSHLYFWPLWDFPVHINTMFPSATYEIRVWIEIIYSIIVGGFILLYGCIIKKKCIFGMLNPVNWNKYSDNPNIKELKKESLKMDKFQLSYMIITIILITSELYLSYF